MLATAKREIKLLLTRGPVYHYNYSRWRINRWLEQRWLQNGALGDKSFLAGFDLEKTELQAVKVALAGGDYSQAGTALVTHFKTRVSPFFFFEQGDIEHRISLISPHQREATIRTADQVCRNSFCFRGVETVTFEDGIDWTFRAENNIDWTWDLNRHAFFETLGRAYWYTGDDRYAEKFQELLLDWLAKNPADMAQPNWAMAFEVAFRINTWLWAFYYFRSTSVFDEETGLAFLKGLLMHGHHLEANLELHLPNNHLLLEAKALAMLGSLFPEYRQAEKWRRQGMHILYQQIRAQVCPDGVHGERATLYHQIIAGQLLELLVLLHNNEVPVPPDIRHSFERMVEFEFWITKPDGRPSLLGDSALADSYLRFSAAVAGPLFLGRDDLKSEALPLDEASAWLLGSRWVKQHSDTPAANLPLESRGFPAGGYFVMRHGSGIDSSYLVFDCGPVANHKKRPGHGHADALSFELYSGGQTLLLDPGVYSTYLGRDWRLFFQGSRAHNTVVVDEQDQSTLVPQRGQYHLAQTSLHRWLTSDTVDFVDGSHNGYQRLVEPIVHRRQLLFVKPEYWVVMDLLSGQGKHCFDLYFHLAPQLNPQFEPGSNFIRAGNQDETRLIIAPLAATNLQADIFTGATDPIQGWVSYFSGKKQPAPVVRYRQEAAAPVQFCTVLYPCGARADIRLQVSPLDVKVEDGRTVAPDSLTGLSIKTETYEDYIVVDRAEQARTKLFSVGRTDARLIYMRRENKTGRLVQVLISGGRQFKYQDQLLLSREEVNEEITRVHGRPGE